MTNQQPSWADLNLTPAAKPTKLKMAGIGCGTLFAATMSLAVLGAIVGPPPKTHTSAAAVASDTPTPTPTPLAPPSVTPTPTKAPTPSPTAPTPTVAKPTPKPSPAPPRVDLVLSGGLTGSTTQADDVLPVRMSSGSDALDTPYGTSDGATQCILAKDDGGYWMATLSFHINGLKWRIVIDEPHLGLPTVGSHPGEFWKPGATDNAVGLAINSDKNPMTGADESSVDTSYGFAYAGDLNHGDPTVTINRDMTSGTIDAWLGPWNASDGAWAFHLRGRWSCR